MGIRRSQKGRAPERPFCLVSNHLSYIDVLIVHASSRCLLIAKADVKEWPLIGFLASLFGTLFIDREKARDVVRIGSLIQSKILAGDAVAFFPEGTSSGGKDVGRFNSSLLEYPGSANFPVNYAAIRYATRSSDPPASEVVCWWGGMTFSPHVYRLLGLKGFNAYIEYSEHAVIASDRKELARNLQEHVKQIFQLTE